MTQNDVMQLFIGKDVGAGTPTTSAGSAIVEASDTYLLDGEMAVVNTHNIVLSAASVLTDDLVAQHGCKVIQRSGTKLIESDVIKQDAILNYKGETGAAAVEQVTNIGFDGSSTSLAIEVNNSTLYVVRILLDELSMTGQGQEIILNAPYKSDAAATQEEIAQGMALSLNNMLRRQVVQPIRLDLLNAAAVDSADCFDATGTIVNGSKTITVATSLAAGGVAAVAGDYIRLSNSADGGTSTGTAITDPVYKIMSVDSTTQVTVDRPVETPSGSYGDTEETAEVILAADAAAANWGIKLTGIARAFSLPKYRYSKVSFKVGLDDGFGVTPTTYTTAMSLGRGTYEELAQLEWDLLGNSGNIYRGDFLYSAERSDAASGLSYAVVSLNHYGNHPVNAIGVNPRRPKQLQLAFPITWTDTEAPDIVIEVLDAYTTIASGLAK